jgi:hypothetical protein
MPLMLGLYPPLPHLGRFSFNFLGMACYILKCMETVHNESKVLAHVTLLAMALLLYHIHELKCQKDRWLFNKDEVIHITLVISGENLGIKLVHSTH